MKKNEKKRKLEESIRKRTSNFKTRYNIIEITRKSAIEKGKKRKRKEKGEHEAYPIQGRNASPNPETPP